MAVSANLRQRLVSLSGEDKPGIMHAASAFFADKGINILSMNVYNGTVVPSAVQSASGVCPHAYTHRLCSVSSPHNTHTTHT